MPRGFFKFPRYWVDKIEVAGRDDCWLWLGAHDGKGYPRVRIQAGNGATKRVHRLIAELVYGEAGRVVHHRCENPGCVNPGHLYVYEENGAHTRDHHSRCMHEPPRLGKSGKCLDCRLERDRKNRERDAPRRREWWRERYKTDAKFREEQKARARENYWKSKR